MSRNLPEWAALWMLPLYFACTILLGWLARRRNENAGSYLSATRSLPLPVVVASYITVNCGALDVMGMSAMAAQYGVVALHFYCLGAIPLLLYS